MDRGNPRGKLYVFNATALCKSLEANRFFVWKSAIVNKGLILTQVSTTSEMRHITMYIVIAIKGPSKVVQSSIQLLRLGIHYSGTLTRTIFLRDRILSYMTCSGLINTL